MAPLIISLLLSLVSFDQTAITILNGSPANLSDSLAFITYDEELKTIANLPDPQLGGEYLVAPEGETNRWATELSWELEWPGVYAQRKKEADLKVAAAREKLRADRIEKLSEIKSLLLDYIYYRQKINIIEDLKLNNDSILMFAQVAAKSGQITVLDLNKVKLENANIRVAISSAYDDLGEIILSLTEIYGSDCSQLLQSMELEFPPVNIPSDQQLSGISETNPTVMAAKKTAAAAVRSKRVALMEALPSLSVGYKHAYEDGIHFNGATLGISLPFFSSHNKQKATRAAIAEAEFNAAATSTAALTEATTLLKRLRLLQQQIEEVEPILQEIDHSRLLLKAYEQKLISMIDYLTERNYYTTASLELLSLRLDAAKLSTKLNLLISD